MKLCSVEIIANWGRANVNIKKTSELTFKWCKISELSANISQNFGVEYKLKNVKCSSQLRFSILKALPKEMPFLSILVCLQCSHRYRMFLCDLIICFFIFLLNKYSDIPLVAPALQKMVEQEARKPWVERV